MSYRVFQASFKTKKTETVWLLGLTSDGYEYRYPLGRQRKDKKLSPERQFRCGSPVGSE